jgi:phosphoribosylamine--glycine ligase
VAKADGLALGKGVLICENVAQAEAALKEIMVDKRFGQSGNKVVIEEFLTGPEVSVLTLTDGKTILELPSAQDHKRALDGDQGKNTGGMGTFSPTPKYTEEIAKTVREAILLPTVAALNKEGRTFRGCIFFGLMLTDKGPKLLEYNARFGDPETQSVLRLLKTDLLELIEAVIDGRLSEIELEVSDEAAVCVALASGGYPQKYETGYEITGLKEASLLPDTRIYHAGTRLGGKGEILTGGGRVLGVTRIGATLDEAIAKAYEAVKLIHFTGMHYRKDIGIK